MNKKFGFIKELNIKSMMENIVKEVLTFRIKRLPVLAEEPNNNGGTDPTNPDPNNTDPNKGSTEPTEPTEPKTVNFEDIVARARKEEKDKLYPQIKELKGQVEKLTETSNKQLLTIEGLTKEKEALEVKLEEANNATSKSDSETVKALKKEIKELNATIKGFEDNKVDIEAIEERIKGEYEVKLYREQKLREAGEAVIPELVTGMTKEDIDASVEASKQRYASIAKGIVSDATQRIPTGNVDTSKMSLKDLRTEDIANMTPAEWAEYRKTLHLK